MTTSPESKYEAAVAIIGMSGRFPGARDVDTFWRNLAAGERSIRRFSDDELLAAGVDPALLQQPNYVKVGTVIDDVDRFDANFFGYSPRDAELMDPQHRLFLECAWEALERAGYIPDTFPGLIGVFGGSASDTYRANNIFTHPELKDSVSRLQLAVGNDSDSLASTVAYKLNLRGPSVAVQSFCSTSLLAVHLACQSLLTYECDIALAGGVAIETPQGTGYLYEEGGILSPDGCCRTFDANAQGSVMGNGVGVVALKRMEDALADGDQIYAVILGTAANNDGLRKVGYTAPGLSGQMSVIVSALNNANVAPDTIGYIEAHGTATPLGDAVELAALLQAFADAPPTQFCALGSVKPNLGHLDRASGVTGLIKTTLALYQQQLPPSLDFERTSPDIDLAHSPFYVNTQLRPWPRTDQPRRAGVNSFGLGGTNVHVVLEEAPPPEPSDASRPWHLLLLAAKSANALDRMTANLADHLAAHPDLALADVAYTLQVGRSAFNHRRAVVVADHAEAIGLLRQPDPQRVFTLEQTSRDRPVAFLLGGVGEQYVGLGRELYDHEPVFRAAVDECCEVLEPQLGLDLRRVLWPATDRTNGAGPTASGNGRAFFGRGATLTEAGPLDQTALAQPAVFVVEYALVQLLAAWGIRPAALLGYSLGEYVAACVAGVLSLPDALRLVATRARLIDQLPRGAMLTVALSESDVAPYLTDEIALAAVNGPRTCVLAGPPEALAVLEARLSAEEIACRPVATTHAFHSPQLQPIAAELTALVATLTLHPPQIPYVSNVTGDWITTAQATDPSYWANHMVQPVRFHEGLNTLLQHAGQVILEIGPGQSLGSFARQHPACTREQMGMILPTLPGPHDRQPALATLLTTLGKLWLHGVTIDWAGFSAHEQRRRTPLPTYPFERQRFWIDRQQLLSQPQPAPKPTGKHADIATWFYAPTWHQSLPVKPEPSTTQPRHWLVFGGTESIGTALVAQLRAQGCHVTTVASGASFAMQSQQAYTIRPDQPEDYQALLRSLAAPPQAIIHLWSVNADQPTNPTAADFDQAQQVGFYSLLYLVQALGNQLITDDLDLWLVTRGVYAITGQEQLQPQHATLVGARTVIGQENLNLSCRVIDIDRPASGSWREERLVKQMLRELVARSADLVVGYREGQRWTQTFEPIAISRPPVNPLRHQGVYLITGGLGAVALTLAEHLARVVQARLILTSHGPFPDRADWPRLLAAETTPPTLRGRLEHIQSLEALGAVVVVVEADVANREQMAAAVQHAHARFDALHGVIHTAGTSNAEGFAPIQDLTRSGCELHFAPKARGLYVLEEVLADQELDFCILFSSLATILGGLGFFGYSAANSFMDSFAHRHNQMSPQAWLSVNWDTWGVRDNPHGDLATTVLEYTMTKPEAIDAFERLLATEPGIAQIVNSTGDLEARFDQWVRGLSFSAADQPAANVYARPQLLTPYVAPINPTEQMIAEVWQAVLGVEVGIEDNFFELGGNSLVGTQVISRLRRVFQSNIPLILLFEAPTVAQMAVAIEMQLLAEIEELDEAEAIRLTQTGTEATTGG